MGATISMNSAAKSASAAIAIVAFAAAEDHGPSSHAGEHRDCASNSGGDGADQDVAVVDVAEFVREYAFEFFVIQQLKIPWVTATEAWLRIASGGEGVGRLGRDHVDLRHGNADFLRQAFDGRVSARKFLAGYGLVRDTWRARFCRNRSKRRSS